MSDLRGRISRIERGMGEQSEPLRWREQLAPYFTEPVYDDHREALLDALCGPDASYSFEVEGDGPDRGRYLIGWWMRDGPPVILLIQRADE